MRPNFDASDHAEANAVANVEAEIEVNDRVCDAPMHCGVVTAIIGPSAAVAWDVGLPTVVLLATLFPEP